MPFIDTKRTKAILIGVSEYQDRSFINVSPIKNNVLKLEKLLLDNNIIGLTQKNILVLDKNESHGEILKRIREFIARDPFDTLIFYFAGHGYKTNNGKLFLVTNNTAKEDVDMTSLPWDNLINKFEVGGKSIQQRFYILDACHSGAATLGEHDEMPEIYDGSALLASAKATTKAYFDKDEEYTYFTGAFINILEKGIKELEQPTLGINPIHEQLDRELRNRNCNISKKTTHKIDNVSLFKNKSYDKVSILIGAGDSCLNQDQFLEAENQFNEALLYYIRSGGRDDKIIEKIENKIKDAKNGLILEERLIAKLKRKQEEERKAREQAKLKRKQEEELIAKELEEQKQKQVEAQKAIEQAELKRKQEEKQKAKELAELKRKQEEERKANEQAELKQKQEEEQKAKEQAELRRKQDKERKEKEQAELKRKQEEEKQKKERQAKTNKLKKSGRDFNQSNGSLSFDMVFVEGGQFTMGSNEKGTFESQIKPVHKVNIPSFYIARYLTTQQLWRVVMGRDPVKLRFKGCDECPVESISWNDIQEFIIELEKITKKKYRLPTEAEWEFAARGGIFSKGYAYSGSDNINEVAWHDENSESKTHPVGKKKGNELGIFDMSGNVWEFVQDNWHKNYHGAPTNGRAWEDGKASKRVSRGSCWYLWGERFHVAHRLYWRAGTRNSGVGFRIAFSI